ncbi:MAG: S-methyl-5-thioribose-1-phosphate isomerase [Desulfobacterales bacterium]|nr:S-methyl-5-thioribose-1-phosphate isomerase [Desulfobacterales bacterium]
MKVDGKDTRPIWLDRESRYVNVIDQRVLPHELVVLEMQTVDDTIFAIKEMVVRGAPLIGITGAYGVYLALKNAPDGQADAAYLQAECARIRAARPTAVNLAWAVDRVQQKLEILGTQDDLLEAARIEAGAIAEEEADNCRQIGLHGLRLIEAVSRRKEGGPVNVLTHCNAGWLATIEYGTATAPIYVAHEEGLRVHVWVDETRPLNQGARLTAWELGKAGIPHTVITDNAGGHLMQHGLVDMVIVGTDRTTHTGDVANKIGTYLKALAAKDNQIPFYVALPSSTFDWQLRDGVQEIPIEERDPDEIRYVQGRGEDGLHSVLLPPQGSPAGNFAFDVTPARLVSAFITERGVCQAREEAIRGLFPEKAGRP